MDVTTSPNRTAEDERAARAAEYGTYRATEPIYFNGVLAFNAGDPVPVSHVKRYDLKGAVERVTPEPEPDEKAKPKP